MWRPQGSPDGDRTTKAANLALAHALERLPCDVSIDVEDSFAGALIPSDAHAAKTAPPPDALCRREPAGGHGTPASRRDPNQTLALIDHRLSVLVPVRVLSGDRAEVIHEWLNGFR